jgi:hypothetical protein
MKSTRLDGRGGATDQHPYHGGGKQLVHVFPKVLLMGFPAGPDIMLAASQHLP